MDTADSIWAMMGQTGTPVVAVESGYVEAIGWNQYGGWRLGIRSFDKNDIIIMPICARITHIRQTLKKAASSPPEISLDILDTGYSATENTNNIDESHLHFGIQLILMNPKEGNGEIWIDCYEIIKFLSINRSESVKVDGTKEWTRIYQMKDPAVGEVTSVEG